MYNKNNKRREKKDAQFLWGKFIERKKRMKKNKKTAKNTTFTRQQQDLFHNFFNRYRRCFSFFI